MKYTAVIFAVLVYSGSAFAGGSVYKDVPDNPDPHAQYIIFLHGAIIEKGGLAAVSPKYGKYEYEAILQAFADRGYNVIGEPRLRKTRAPKYARKVSAQIKKLTSSGIPPKSITVAGFSKGGAITFFTSSMLQDFGLSFVIIAGCGAGRFEKSFESIRTWAAPNLRGRFLSIYDSNDRDAGSCKRAFDIAGSGIRPKEIKLNKELGHGLFYKPDGVWIDPIAEWIGGGSG